MADGRTAQATGVVGRVPRGIGLRLVGIDDDDVDQRAGDLDRALGRVLAGASCLTWAITFPPLLRAAMAMASMSPRTASSSSVRLPSSSAVLARMTATSMGNAW